MNFGEQFKKIRSDLKLTQEQVAMQLNVSRQAISNWENNKNLPDIEMIVNIAKNFGLTMDQLIFGGETKNNLTEKLIRDGSETRRAKFNLVAICIGTVILLFGVGCILIKAFSVEYIDQDGILHENFFLLPIGFLLIFCGVVVFLITGIRNIVAVIKKSIERKRLVISKTE